MSADCCGHGGTFEGLSADYKRRLWLVIAINASMFFVEMAAGALAGSQALQSRFCQKCVKRAWFPSVNWDGWSN
jgi:Co/Zn/Cd efflux system component